MGETVDDAPPQIEKPDTVDYLYSWWLKLYSTQKLTFTELKAFIDLSGINLRPWQVDAIMNIDYEYHRALNNGNSR